MPPADTRGMIDLAALLRQMSAAGLPMPSLGEYLPPYRAYRLALAWPDRRAGVVLGEVPAGLAEHAEALGWRVIGLAPDGPDAVALVRGLLQREG